MIRLRLARHGKRNTPFYHIVAIQNHKPRNALPIETLGIYDPIPRILSPESITPAARVFGREKGEQKKEKRVEWSVDRIRYWLSVGAQPTKTVIKLLERGGVLTTPHKWQHAWSPPPPTITESATTSPIIPS
ncbi:ribosomal protein S16 [Tremella mesenterica]|uniref:Ribosomal protein S16 n=1 Tax=Tremella mesenterica TaxID=5217 RepID=A0A4Q1BGS3_TREME|nr:uncharacterized protein TREMEDRAFT_63916 [Tremella mesenterica DSM 1558]EIW68030.1 hypothetical protein TREMEDRAFT_63916 [Tremella mesenterica DSM 1558]RXK36748.1 ribosomal protein S16 [Tremella mesenterica]